MFTFASRSEALIVFTYKNVPLTYNWLDLLRKPGISRFKKILLKKHVHTYQCTGVEKSPSDWALYYARLLLKQLICIDKNSVQLSPLRATRVWSLNHTCKKIFAPVLYENKNLSWTLFLAHVKSTMWATFLKQV